VGIVSTLIRFLHFALPTATSSSKITAVDRRRKAIVSLLVGAFVLLLLHVSLIVVCESSRLLRDPLYADKERKLGRLEASLPPGSPEIVFLGTSRAGNGFDAGRAQALASAKLGSPVLVFNWGIPGAGPVTHLIHMRRILQDGHRPSLLLLEILPSSLAVVPGGSLESRLCEGDTLDWSELDWLGNYGYPVDRLHEERRAVLEAPWFELRTKIVGRLRPTMLPYNSRYDWSRGPDINGWCPIVEEKWAEEQRAEALKRTRSEYADLLANMQFDDAAAHALREVIAVAQRAEIPVRLVRMPEASHFRSFYPPTVAANIERFLNELAHEFGCRCCNASTWMADDSFVDWHHMWPKHAGIFTEKLTRVEIEPFLQSVTEGSP